MKSSFLKYKYNFAFLLSSYCFLYLFISFSLVNILIAIILGFFYLYWLSYRKKWEIRFSKDLKKNVYCVVFTVFILFVIYKILFVKHGGNLLPNQCIMLALGSFSIFVGLNESSERIKLKKMTYRTIVLYIFFFIVSAIFTAICSRTSWLYTINDASDPNIFFSVGKSIMNGRVLYRDIFEQKGFYIYLLHGLASWISPTSMIGVYVLEVLINWIFLIFGRKILRLYVKNDWVSFTVIPVCFAIYVASNCFWYGDNAEEICSPFLLYGLYILLKNLKNHTFPSKKEYFIIGLTSGFILWIKYTMLGFYIGWYISLLLLIVKTKKMKEILLSIRWIVFGVLGISLPVLIYFMLNHSLQYLWESYFYDNIFLYTIKAENQSASKLVFDSVINNVINNPQLSILVLLSLVWMIFQTSCIESIGYLCCLIGLIISTFIGGRYYPYYYSCIVIFVFPGCIYLYCVINKFITSNNWVRILSISFITCIGYMILTSRNIAYINKAKESYPQYKFAQIMKQIENPSLLNYGALDNGFNLYADILPSNRFYCSFNVPLEEMNDEQNRIIQDGSVDFFISYSPDFQLDNYELISTVKYDRGEGITNYCLYARKDLQIIKN